MLNSQTILLFSSAPRLERGELNSNATRPSEGFIRGSEMIVDVPASEEEVTISLPRNKGICKEGPG
jgi:hypothetical protein